MGCGARRRRDHLEFFSSAESVHLHPVVAIASVDLWQSAGLRMKSGREMILRCYSKLFVVARDGAMLEMIFIASEFVSKSSHKTKKFTKVIRNKTCY